MIYNQKFKKLYYSFDPIFNRALSSSKIKIIWTLTNIKFTRVRDIPLQLIAYHLRRNRLLRSHPGYIDPDTKLSSLTIFEKTPLTKQRVKEQIKLQNVSKSHIFVPISCFGRNVD